MWVCGCVGVGVCCFVFFLRLEFLVFSQKKRNAVFQKLAFSTIF